MLMQEVEDECGVRHTNTLDRLTQEKYHLKSF